MAKRYAPFQFKQFALAHQQSAHKIGTDAIVLASWLNGASARQILDFGSGCGVLSFISAQRFPNAQILGIEVDEASYLESVANKVQNPFAHRLNFLHQDIQEFEPTTKFDLIVSNPPYVADGEAQDLDPEIREWEPGAALYAGPDGLAALRRIATGAGPYLKPGGLLALEVGLGQATYIMELLENTGEFRTVRVCRDLSGRERVVLAHGEMTD